MNENVIVDVFASDKVKTKYEDFNNSSANEIRIILDSVKSELKLDKFIDNIFIKIFGSKFEIDEKKSYNTIAVSIDDDEDLYIVVYHLIKKYYNIDLDGGNFEDIAVDVFLRFLIELFVLCERKYYIFPFKGTHSGNILIDLLNRKDAIDFYNKRNKKFVDTVNSKKYIVANEKIGLDEYIYCINSLKSTLDMVGIFDNTFINYNLMFFKQSLELDSFINRYSEKSFPDLNFIINKDIGKVDPKLKEIHLNILFLYQKVERILGKIGNLDKVDIQSRVNEEKACIINDLKMMKQQIINLKFTKINQKREQEYPNLYSKYAYAGYNSVIKFNSEAQTIYFEQTKLNKFVKGPALDFAKTLVKILKMPKQKIFEKFIQPNIQ